jgi:hypothetical protein
MPKPLTKLLTLMRHACTAIAAALALLLFYSHVRGHSFTWTAFRPTDREAMSRNSIDAANNFDLWNEARATEFTRALSFAAGHLSFALHRSPSYMCRSLADMSRTDTIRWTDLNMSHRSWSSPKSLVPVSQAFGWTGNTPLERLALVYHNTGDGRILVLPLWLLSLLLFLPLIVYRAYHLLFGLKRRHRLAANLCPTCSYDIRASATRCPECNTPLPPPNLRGLKTTAEPSVTT